MSSDLFESTAEYYARYRPDYPQALYETVARAFGLDGSGRLLDIGCGDGRVALALRDRFAQVVGIDVSAEMIAEARRQAERAGATNVEWLVMPAEAVSAELGTFRLVACGAALHWMDHERVLALCYQRVEHGGGIALVGTGAQPGSGGAIAPWDRVVTEVVQRWLGERRRAGEGYFEPDERRWEDALADSAFVDVEQGAVRVDHVWDVDAIIGQLDSTSYANRRLLGKNVEAFEAELREALLALEPSGRYEQEQAAEWVFAWKR